MALLSLEKASVSFPLYSDSARSFRNTILQNFLPNQPKKISVVQALNEITVSISTGDRIGLIGLNGAGKSTFLRLLAGIYAPSTGAVTIEGKVSTLFDLNLGMDEEATGYENMFIAGALLGISKQDMRCSVQDIENFTELGEYLSRPIKTYSAGMRVRLAFAIATTSHSDIMLIDEIIGVGDRKFLTKASERIKKSIECSQILVLASHAEFVLRDFCTSGIVFDQSRIVKTGLIGDCIDFYNKEICK